MWKRILWITVATATLPVAGGHTEPISPHAEQRAIDAPDPEFSSRLREHERQLQDDLRSLQAQLGQARTDAEKFDVIRLVQQRKLEAQRQLFELQIERAEKLGNALLVEELEEAARSLDSDPRRESGPRRERTERGDRK